YKNQGQELESETDVHLGNEVQIRGAGDGNRYELGHDRPMLILLLPKQLSRQRVVIGLRYNRQLIPFVPVGNFDAVPVNYKGHQDWRYQDCSANQQNPGLELMGQRSRFSGRTGQVYTAPACATVHALSPDWDEISEDHRQGRFRTQSDWAVPARESG